MDKNNRKVWDEIHSCNLKNEHLIENSFPSKCAQSFYKFHVSPFVLRNSITDFLEIGCGTGGNLSLFINPKINLNAVDISQNALDKAKIKYEKYVKFKKSSASDLPFEDSSQDFILADGCLYYSSSIEEYKKNFDEIYRVLRPGGQVRIYDKASDDMIVKKQNQKSKFIYYSSSKWERSMPLICPSREFLLDITKNFKNVIIGKEKFNHIDHLEINQHSFWVITLTK